MELKLHNQPLDVEVVRLVAPPEGGNRLATSRQLLVAWRSWSSVSGRESGKRYHLTFYHPDYGWRACRWDEKHGRPIYARPTSENATWVSTDLGQLIYISFGDEIEATMLASVERSILSVLHADADNLWIRGKEIPDIMQLRLQKEGLTIVNRNHIFSIVNGKYISFDAHLMYPLADGACALVSDKRIYVFRSLLLEKKIYEENSRFFCYPPFLGRKDEGFYYTEDPRRGWEKMPISIEDENDEILFLAKHNDIYCAAVYRRQRDRTLLYRFSGESKTDAEYMWEISGRFHSNQFAMYNGLVCITDDKPLVISGREDVPENHGFLVWNPRSNTFYEDIPQSSVMHARSIIPHKLQIPMAWSDRSEGQDIQGADR